jgi:VWFA-related protein
LTDKTNNGEGYLPATVSALNYVSRLLGRVSGRKNLIWLSGEFPLELSPKKDVPVANVQMTKAALDIMAQNQVALYPVDLRGVSVKNPSDPDTGERILPRSYQLQDQIAKWTGGRAFHSDNQIKELLNHVVQDGANYYTLTYAPSNRNYDGALRHIQVNITDKRYNISYPSSYHAYDRDAPPPGRSEIR